MDLMIKRTAAVVVVLLLLLTGTAVAAPNDEYFEEQYGLEKIEAEEAWGHSVGDGIVIAIVDTGIDKDHVDLNLTGKIVKGIDLVDPGTYPDDETSKPEDCNGGTYNPGHGTHVSGIAGAITNNQIGVAGTAPGAKLMPVRVLNKCGEGTVPDVNEGIVWAADNGAKVINLSLGDDVVFRNVAGSSIEDGIDYAFEKGAVVVIAAGNDVLLPSGYRDVNALVVQATNENDARPIYSNSTSDAKWGIAAPGHEILSTVPNNRLAYLSGTSMAAPHVSGAAAILLCLGLTQEQTIERLLDTADNIGPLNAERLNVGKAVQGEGTCFRSGSTGSGNPGPGGGGGGGSNPRPGGTGVVTSPGTTPPPQEEPSPGSEPGAGADENPPPGSISSIDQPPGEGPEGPNTNLILLAVIAVGGTAYYLVFKARRSNRRAD